MHLAGWQKGLIFHDRTSSLHDCGGGARAAVKGSLVFAGVVRCASATLKFGGGSSNSPVARVPRSSLCRRLPGKPLKSGQAVVDNLNRYGVKAELVLIAPRLKDIDLKAAVRDPANVAKLRKATGVWFIGGDQERITKALLNTDGSQTPALKAIWMPIAMGPSSAAAVPDAPYVET